MIIILLIISIIIINKIDENNCIYMYIIIYDLFV